MSLTMKKNEIDIQHYKTKAGDFILGSFNEKLCLLDFKYRKMRQTIDKRILTTLNANFIERNNKTLQHTKKQLNEYLSGQRTQFDIPLLLVGTDFQKNVWKHLMKVPYGTTLSYIDLAHNIGNKLAIRAVGAANGANAISIIIPCHRIIGNDGKLVGYGGGLNTKKYLLTLENPALFEEKMEQLLLFT